MKSKLLPILLILLALLNGVLLFILIEKPHEKRQNHPQRSFLTEQLNFTENQQQEFRALDRGHRDFMMSLDEEINKHKEVLFNSFSKQNFNIENITSKIGVLEGRKENEVFRFFSEVRKFCDSKQVLIFDKIIQKALKGGSRKPPRRGEENHPPRREGRMPPPR